MEHLLGLFEDKFEEISIKIRAINITEEMKSTSKFKKYKVQYRVDYMIF